MFPRDGLTAPGGGLGFAAVETGRSLNKMILTLLETAVGPHKSDRLVLLDRIRARRSTLHHLVDDASLEEAIEEGRA